jgi:SAM-dependent methyltransferase
MSDVLGQALYDHFHSKDPGKLWIHNRYGAKELMPVETYFRNEDDMPDLEWLAMEKCTGKVLDVGAGAGSHALILQDNEHEVTALDISPLAVEVMKSRGVTNVIAGDIYNYTGQQFDTILLLMNGIGLAGSIAQSLRLLTHLQTLLTNDGQIIFDSSDVAYLYDGTLPAAGDYYGEIWYQYEYKRQKTDWFKWLYIDQQMLLKVAHAAGFNVEILYEDEHDQYLASLRKHY